jgi:selenocysteine lyase/cysteine desulfurase
MTIDILTNVTISNFWSGARFVFDKGREKIKFKQHDPAGYGDQINPLDNVTTVEDAVSRFQTAYNRAVKAEHFANNGKIAEAYDEWRKIFGGYFPAYG